MTFKTIIGSRAEVWHGTAKHTSGGLTKTHLMKNKSGRIVSRKKHLSAKRDNRLVKAGYKTKKGHFGFVKTGSKSRRHSKGKKMRGGMAHNLDNADSADHSGNGSNNGNNIAGAGITDFGPSSTSVQMRAGMAGGKRRKHHMVGGTTKPFADVSMSSPLNRALNA
jgi:hypothetical protein